VPVGVRPVSLLHHQKAVPSTKQKNPLSLPHICFSVEESYVWSRWRKISGSPEHQIPLLIFSLPVVKDTLYWTQIIHFISNPGTTADLSNGLLPLIHSAYCPFENFTLLKYLVKSIFTFLSKGDTGP